MRKVLFLFFFSFSFIHSAVAAPLENIIFFGDSLTDNGNLYRLDMHLLPKSPPYFAGRFSNGPTWAEVVAENHLTQSGTKSGNYAWGGATTVTHSALHEHTFPVTLAVEMDRYLLDSLFRDKSNTLYSFWIGGNDYMFDKETDVDTLTSRVVSEITRAINMLTQFHAQHFLILSLPDLGKIPSAQENVQEATRLSNLTIVHNKKLALAVDALQKAHPDATFVYVDIGYFFHDLLNDPEKYNRLRHVHIKNTTDACWHGGYRLKSIRDEAIYRHEQPIRFTKNALNKDALSQQTLLSMPDLREAWQTDRLARAGFVACTEPDTYVFWDGIHPSAVAHRMIASRVEDALQQAKLN